MKKLCLFISLSLLGIMSLPACEPAIEISRQTPILTPVMDQATAALTPTWTPVVIPSLQPTSPYPGYKDIAYQVEGHTIMLKDGVSEKAAAPGSSMEVVTRDFGYETVGDLNGDNLDDVAFVLTQDMGGSGTFFYVGTALRSGNGYVGTNGVILGDRIEVQSVSIGVGLVTVVYLDRNVGEPFTARPSLELTKVLRVIEGSLVEVSP
jgi:hypothetical protein